MISDLCKLVKVALTSIDNHVAVASRLRQERCPNRTDALLGQGNALISRGREITSRDVRRMRSKVLSHDFAP